MGDAGVIVAGLGLLYLLSRSKEEVKKEVGLGNGAETTLYQNVTRYLQPSVTHYTVYKDIHPPKSDLPYDPSKHSGWRENIEEAHEKWESGEFFVSDYDPGVNPSQSSFSKVSKSGVVRR